MSTPSLRDAAKSVIRALAREDLEAGITRDGLTVEDVSGEAADACRVLKTSAYSVWCEAYKLAERYKLAATFPTASALLELWERPWSGTALRNAGIALARVQGKLGTVLV